MSKEYITLKELCAWIRLSKSHIYKLVSQNKIPHIKLGGKILFDKEKIQDWIDSQSN